MNETVSEIFYHCPNGHNLHHSNHNSALLSAVTTSFASIAQWISIDTRQTTACCQKCQYPVSIKLKFCSAPLILAFEFSAHPNVEINHSLGVQVENSVKKYYLAAVVYYSHEHFTSQIITRDGQVWYYDGMLIADPAVEPTLHCTGSINDPLFSVQDCRGGTPCATMYCL